VFILEVIDEFLQSRVTTDVEAVPDRPLGVAVLLGVSIHPNKRRKKERDEERKITLFFAAAIGSEKPKKGSAKLTNPFL
jgi:hypothetical protein